MTPKGQLTGSKTGHEAGETGTAIKPASKWGQCKKVARTHIDSANPFRFLGGTERSPFFPYCWIRAGARAIRTRYARYRPNKDQSNGEDASELHTSGASERADVGQNSGLFIVCVDALTQREVVDGANRHPGTSRTNAVR